jgi:hypothetical protein
MVDTPGNLKFIPLTQFPFNTDFTFAHLNILCTNMLPLNLLVSDQSDLPRNPDLQQPPPSSEPLPTPPPVDCQHRDLLPHNQKPPGSQGCTPTPNPPDSTNQTLRREDPRTPNCTG